MPKVMGTFRRALVSCGVLVVVARMSQFRWSNLTSLPHIWRFCRWHARCEMGMRVGCLYLKGKLIMKKLVSFLLSAVVLFGAATLGLQSATANAKDRHDKNYWRQHRRQHRHHRHRWNK